MSDEPPAEEESPRFTRPWETDDIPEPRDDDEAETVAGDDVEAEDTTDLPEGTAAVEEFTHDDYLAATTREYQGLAEEVARASEEEVAQQAVAAAIPGVGTGLIGFDDVTGRRGVTEEDVEAAEQARASDLTLRVGTAVVLVSIFIGTLLLGRGWFTGFVVVVAIMALGEFFATTRMRRYAPAALFAFLGVIGAVVGTLRWGAGAVAVSLGFTAVVVGVFFSVAGRRRALDNASVTLLGAAWLSLLAFAVAIADSEVYVGLILLVVLVTAGFDIGSYFAGRAFGRRAMAPRISPKKTWEGYLGGVFAALILAAIFSTFRDIFAVDFRQSLIFGGMVAVLAPLGDAAESVVKRSLDVKDMGSILPGHGGMLDRIDALLFVLPGAYLLYQAFDLV